MDKKILFIGGSPCSGKSTVAERLASDKGAYYFKVDDFLDEFMEKAAGEGSPICKMLAGMCPDEVWMRDPQIQCDQEFMVYREIAPYVFEKLQELDADVIITEGAAYTPKVMELYGAYIQLGIVPSPDFQISHYKQREWVPYVLADCRDKEKAFANWMERDILFAAKLVEEYKMRNIPYIVNDGSKSIDEMYREVLEMLSF